MNQGYEFIPLELRIILIITSVLNLIFVLLRIRKSKIQIIDSIFWIIFSAFLIIIASFPDVIIFFMGLARIKTATNFVYLCIIFLLIIKLFLTSMKISQLEIKLKTISQKIALEEYRNKELNKNISDDK